MTTRHVLCAALVIVAAVAAALRTTAVEGQEQPNFDLLLQRSSLKGQEGIPGNQTLKLTAISMDCEIPPSIGDYQDGDELVLGHGGSPGHRFPDIAAR